MEQYIPKSTLVAEIEKRKKSRAKQREDMLKLQCYTLADDALTRIGELNYIQDFLDTLEVKEMDLEKENLTPNDLSIIWVIITNLITELRLRINKWPGEKIFEEALKRFRAQKGE